MSSYPINPRTGRPKRQPPFGVAQTLVEIMAALVLGFIAVTMVAAVLYSCVMLWVLMLK
jgi:hypothetical protein